MSYDQPPRRRKNDEGGGKGNDEPDYNNITDLPLILRDFELAVHNFTKTGSKMAELDLKKFQHSNRLDVHLSAVMALQEALMREWHALGDQQLSALRRVLFEWPLAHVSQENEKLRTAMYHLGAIMLKRAWLAPTLQETQSARESREQVMNQIGQLLSARDGAMVREGVRILAAILDVVKRERINFLDVPLSFHLRVRATFEQRYLPQLTALCVPLLRQCADSTDPRVLDLLDDVLTLLADVLTWPFAEGASERASSSGARGGGMDDGSDSDGDERFDSDDDDDLASSASVSLQPGEAWRALLVDSGELWEVLVALNVRHRRHSRRVAVVAQCVMAMATLQGAVFHGEPQRQHYVQRLLRGALQLMQASVAEGTGQAVRVGEVSDVAKLLVSIARAYSYQTLLAAAHDLAQHAQTDVFEALAAYAEHVMALARSGALTGSLAGRGGDDEMLDDDDDDDGSGHAEWDDGDVDIAMGAVEELLEVWLLLVTAAPDAPMWPPLCARIYAAYVQTRLQLATAELEQRESRLSEAMSENDEEREIELLLKRDRIEHKDELVSAALLARHAAAQSAAVLVPRLADTQQRLATLAQREPSTLSVPELEAQAALLEQAHWLTLLAGHLLADDVLDARHHVHQSDVHIPPALAAASAQSRSPTEDPVIGVGSAVFALVELENACIAQQRMAHWSPLLAESLVWFLQRWTLTYLARVDDGSADLPPHLRDAYATAQQREAVLEFLLRKVARNLLAWSAESDVAEESCRLFVALARLRLSAAHLRALPAWRELFHAHTQQVRELLLLPGKAQRMLAQGFVALALGDSDEERAAYVAQVAQPVAQGLLAIVHAPEFQAEAGKGHTMMRVWTQLDRVRGVLRGASAATARAVWAWAQPLLPTLVALYRGYAHDHASVISLLQLWVDLVHSLLELLPPREQHDLLDATGTLITAFQQAGHAQGPKKKAGKDKRATQSDLAQYQRLVKMYKVLAALAAYPEQPKSAQMSWFGLAVTVPAILLDPGLLNFPKLAKLHFALVLDATKHHAHALAQLPDFLFQGVLKTLLFVLAVDSDLPEGTLERDALQTVALWLTPHLALRARERRDFYTSELQRNTLSEFTERVLSFILRSPSSTRGDLRSAAADAYLACLAYDAPRYQQWIEALGSRQESALRQPLALAFASLHESLHGEPTFERAQRSRFEGAFDAFLATARGLITWPK